MIKRRITFVIEKLAHRSGGAERVLIDVANALSERGHQVEIISHEFRGKPPFYPLRFGVVHTNIRPQRKVRSTLRRLVDNVRGKIHQYGIFPPPLDRVVWFSRHGGFWRRLERHLNVTEPDAVVAFMPPAITALSLTSPIKRPIKLASMHNAPKQDFENPLRWDPAPYDRRRRLELMSGMDRIGVLLPEYKNWYPAELSERVIVIPNAVHRVPVQKLFKSRRRIILGVGRLAHVKRHDLLLRAFARLADKFPEWELQIYGTGPLEAELNALRNKLGLQGRAFLMGHTKKINEIYLESSILAHPAQYEGFPLAVTESLASGLPVVGFSDCSGLNQLVKNGQNGILVDAGDDTEPSAAGSQREDAFVVALEHVMANDDLRRRLGDAGPSSMEPFTPDRVIDQWEKTLLPDDAP